MPRATTLALASIVVWLAVCLAVCARPVQATEPTSPPDAEATYRAAAQTWNEAWRSRPSLYSRKEKDCLAAWQRGDEIRSEIKATTPPPRFAAYHEALLAYVDAALEVSDECLVQPRGGPQWGAKLEVSRERRGALIRAAKAGGVDLPRTW